ncbi:MAG: glycine cleavage system aminomethyltransferase GcvT [Gemmatimonadota bacterium]
MSGGSRGRPAEPGAPESAGAATAHAGTGARPLKETGLVAVHRALDAKLVPFAGWLMPIQYDSITAEHRAVRASAGLFDISHMGELFVSGSGAAEFLDRMTVNDVSALDPGGAQYSCLCRPDGGILDDIVLYRLEDGFQVVVNASNAEKDREWLRAHLPQRGVRLEDRSEETSLLALQGPRAQEILAPLASVDLERIPFYGSAAGTVAGTPALIARTGYTGEDGFELYFARERSVPMWTALEAAGAPAGLRPAGLGARDTLRLEMKYALYGNDIDETTNPLEAGLGWIVKLDKRDFVGRDALRRGREQGAARRLVGFRLLERGFPRPGYPVLAGGERVAEVRSGTVSPCLNEGIGTCYVPTPLARRGTRLEVEIRGKPVPAVVAPTPFYTGGSLRR